MENQMRNYNCFLAFHGYKSELISKLLTDGLLYSNISKNPIDEHHCLYSGELNNLCSNVFFVYCKAVNSAKNIRVVNKSFMMRLLCYIAFKMLRRNNVVDINTLLLITTMIDYCNPNYINLIKNVINENGIDIIGRTKSKMNSLREQCITITDNFIKENGTILYISKFLDMMFIDGLSINVHYRWIKLFTMQRFERLKTSGKFSILDLYDIRLNKSYTSNYAAMFGSVFEQGRDVTISKIRNYIHNDLNECVANNHVQNSKLYKAIVNFLNNPYGKSEYYIPTIVTFNRLIKNVLKVDLSFDHLSSVNKDAKTKLEFIQKFLSIDETTNGKNVKSKFIPTASSLAKEHEIVDMQLNQVLYNWFDL